MKPEPKRVRVAKLGKVVGLKGEIKLYIDSDFLEQFEANEVLHLKDGTPLHIEYYNPQREIVKFQEFSQREEVAKLVNADLFSSVEDTRKKCHLKEGEYFWFDLEGLRVEDGERVLGRVKSVDRIANQDYLLVQTDKTLLEQKMAKQFYIPYVDAYIQAVDLEEGVIHTQNGYLLLESL